MIWVIARHQVRNYDEWKPVFDSTVAWIRETGGQKYYVSRDTDNPNWVTVAIAWKTLPEAEGFIKAPRLKEAMGRAGVIGEPEIHYTELADYCDLTADEPAGVGASGNPRRGCGGRH